MSKGWLFYLAGIKSGTVRRRENAGSEFSKLTHGLVPISDHKKNISCKLSHVLASSQTQDCSVWALYSLVSFLASPPSSFFLSFLLSYSLASVDLLGSSNPLASTSLNNWNYIGIYHQIQCFVFHS